MKSQSFSSLAMIPPEKTCRVSETRQVFYCVIALLLLAFALRVHDLTEAPLGLDGDETFYWQDANSVLNGNLQIFYPTNYGHEPLFIYAEAVFLFLFGHNSFAMRYTAVFGSMILLAGSYTLACRMFNRRVALVTLALLATLFWPLFAGRIGLRFAYSPLFCGLSLLSLFGRRLRHAPHDPVPQDHQTEQ